MNLRESLLAHLRDPDYRPANELALLQRLGLNKKQRAQLAHEVRRLLAQKVIRRGQGERLELRHSPATPPAKNTAKVPERGIFQASRHRGKNAGPATAPGPSAPTGGAHRVDRDELIGRIQFRAGGSAFVVLADADGGPGDNREPALQIFPEETHTALPGDLVAVRIFHGRKGKRPGEKIGQVTRVLERGRGTIVGNLKRSGRYWTVAADDPRFPLEILVPEPSKSALKPVPQAGDKVVVTLDDWHQRRDALSGQLSARLGRTHEPRAELLGIFEKYNLATQFPTAVEREAADLPDRVNPNDRANRLDYRDVPTFTIDPDDAKDFDDALSYEQLEHDEVRIGIHIADVSAYVKPGTALDREAQNRGNSTYLVGTVIPMLPEKLSNGLCSLVEGQDRLTKAVFLTFNKHGALRHTAYANTVIRSRKRLTYKQAFALLNEHDLDKIRALPLPPKHQTGSTGRALSSLSDAELTDLQNWVRALWRIALKLRRARIENGSLDLDMPETKIFVDPEGYADRLEKIINDESHQLIEEFMLAANEAVAHVTRIQRLPSLYRVHDDPDPEKLGELRQLLGTFQIQTGDLTKREEVVKLLKILSTHPQGYTLRTQLLRSLRKACYRAKPDGHYGLAKKDYTHFTSPIRRYADLVVHRVFDSYLIKHAGYPSTGAHGPGYDLKRVDALGEHLSLTEINSTEAERDSVKIKLLEFFERELDRKPRTRFAAVITDVRQHGCFVELIESMTFGFVPTAFLSDDHYVLNGAGTMLTGRKHKRRFELNGRLDVVVERVDRFKRLIDFRPAD
jgi:ribonuclease R